jgi:hypothetical protein
MGFGVFTMIPMWGSIRLHKQYWGEALWGRPLCNLFPKIPKKVNMYATKFPHAKSITKNL